MHYVLVETGEAGPDDRLETCFGDDKLGAIRACNRVVNGLAANGWIRDIVEFAGSSYTWRKPGEQARTVRVAEYAYCDHGIQSGCQSLTCCSTREEQRIHEAENEEAFDDPTPYTVEIDDLTEEQATALRRQLMELLPDLAEQVNVYKWNGSDDEGCVESAQHDLERAQVAKPTFEQIVEARVGPPMVYGTVEQGKTFPEGARRIPVQGYEQESI